MRKKNKVFLGTISLLIVFTITISISYAYWKLTYTATKVNKIVSSCFSMELTNEKNNIVLDDAYPISDEKGKALTPYSFTITNTCDLFASYTINLEMLAGTTLNSKYIKTMVNNEAITNLNTLETTDPSIEGATESRILFKGSLGSGDSTDYAFRVWIDSDTPYNEDSMNKVFQGKITVTAEVSTYSPVENGFTNLADALLVNEYQTTSLDVAKNKIASKQEVDFSKTAPIIEWQENEGKAYFNYDIRKVVSDYIGSYGITDKTTKILLATSYEFNKDTGYYTLKDTEYYNPEEIDFSTSYYFCNSGIGATSNGNVTYSDSTSCVTLYKIKELVSAVDSEWTISSTSTTITTKLFTFKVNKLTAQELESDKSDKGIYESQDDYGTTYYYRGNVTNNYVKFAGYYWRVIRINGDSSVRLLYAGTNPNSIGSELLLGNNAYNPYRNDETYVGYMYSNTIDSSYEETLKNDNDSSIKIKLDNWYKTNIFDKGYNSYIADSGFCNDRSLATNSPGNGYNSSSDTYYSSRYRIMNNNPIFSCPNPSNDLFTLSGNSKGNGSLTYPIGLITIDELAFAGQTSGYINKLNYVNLYSNLAYWTMSPRSYSGVYNNANLWYLTSSGGLESSYATGNFGVRPVINLKNTTEITSGIGTKNDPFVIK